MKSENSAGSGKSAYIRLYEQMRSDIVTGAYAYGTKIPSKRVTSEKTGLSVITVEHAYTLLCDEGYIEPKERSGYFVIYRESDFFTGGGDREDPPKKTPKIEVKSDFPFSVIAGTMRKVLSDRGEQLLEKTPNTGAYEFRKEISRYLARSRGIRVSPEQIVIGAGAEYLYGLMITLLGRNRVYAFEKPSYEKIEQVYRANGVKTEALPLGNDGVRSESLAKCCASVLHITPYRSFPSGVTATVSKRMEYLFWASQKNRYIIEDDFESEFTISKKPEETIFSLSDRDNIIYINTFSKTVSSSLRVGYMVLPESLVGEFESKAGFYSCTVPAFEQMVLCELISSGNFERHINRVRRKLRKEIRQ